MNNNEFMNLLTIVNKNYNNRNQLIAFGVIAGLALTGCYLFYLKNKEINLRNDKLSTRHIVDRTTMRTYEGQILRLNNTIKQLMAEKDIKPNNNPGNDTSSIQDTTS